MAGFKEDIQTPDKANAVFLAGLAFPLKETDPDYAALRLGNFLFGGGSLSSRLGNRIRQKEGLSYGVSSSLTASSRDPVATFTVNAITNPVNIDRVEKAVVEELHEFLLNGPSPTELRTPRRRTWRHRRWAAPATRPWRGKSPRTCNWVGRSCACANRNTELPCSRRAT